MARSPTGSGVVEADAAAETLSGIWELLVGAIAGAWCERRGGAIAAVTGADVPNLNGVWAYSTSADPDATGDLLDRVADTGLPHCVQLRAGATDPLVAVVESRRMIASDTVPLMVLDDGAALGEVPQRRDLVLRRLEPDEAELHVLTASAGFGAPQRIFRRVVTPATLSLPGVRCYIGEAGGHPVTTGIGVSLGGAVGIFNVATPPEHRGRGYGAAMTARAARDGLEAGDRYAFLQASPDGLSIYRQMGFRTVEQWRSWLRGQGASTPASPPA